MKRKVNRKGYLKERIVMAACAVTVLSALTAAGLWMREDDKVEDGGYVVDLSEIENSTVSQSAQEEEVELAQNVTVNEEAVTSDDLDYDPYFQETNSANVENTANVENAAGVENPDQSESISMSEGADDTPAISTAMQPTLSFGDSDSLVWPVVGNILINYSMDKTIYFPTLDQYKYNPAIVIQANEGDMITAAAAGKVISVFTDPQIGNGVTMDLGNGYEVTYGQLTDILVSEGSYVSMGDMIAQVAAPTKYYSVEGTNVYFKLTKDGEPVNPMTRLN